MFYRRRTANHGRKAGNVADFVRNWGGRYDYMVVFDADSLMSARALTQLVQRMDDSPRTALVQTLPSIVNAQTLFARSPAVRHARLWPDLRGGACLVVRRRRNFWGHNAIIRVARLCRTCRTAGVAGAAPLGGPIMSHDFVEAALLRRAGWRVEIAPDISRKL